MEWQQFAKCEGADSDIFFSQARQQEAMTYCAECPVKGFCKYEGTRTRSDGVWGGTTEHFRRTENGVNPVFIEWG